MHRPTAVNLKNILKQLNFVLKNNLSYPKETSEFFKGRVEDGNLEDYKQDSILEYIKNGIEISLPLKSLDDFNDEFSLDVKKIPKECDKIIIKIY